MVNGCSILCTPDMCWSLYCIKGTVDWTGLVSMSCSSMKSTSQLRLFCVAIPSVQNLWLIDHKVHVRVYM